MNFRTLGYFVAVAELGNMSRASEQLNVSQPAVSKAISSLEHEVGYPLFLRQSGRLSLTDYGEQFLQHARAMLAELRNSQANLDGLREGRSGLLRIGAVPVVVPELVSRALARVFALLPGVRLSIRTDSQIPTALGDGTLDLIISHYAEDQPPDWAEQDYLFTPQLRVVASKAHPLARREGLTLEELAEENWIMPPQDMRPFQVFAEEFKAHNLSVPANHIQIHSRALTYSLLAEGRFLCMMPVHPVCSGPHWDQLTVLSVPMRARPWSIGVITRRRAVLPTVARVFKEALHQVVKESETTKPRLGLP